MVPVQRRRDQGAYYTTLLAAARKDGRITRVPYDPALPVDTDWDLGIGDAMAIWFSQSLRSGEVRLIDYYENSGEGLPHYAGVLKEKGYVYGEHWAPHRYSCSRAWHGQKPAGDGEESRDRLPDRARHRRRRRH